MSRRSLAISLLLLLTLVFVPSRPARGEVQGSAALFPGGNLGAFRLSDVDMTAHAFSPVVQSAIVFCANWSSSSRDALRSVTRAAGGRSLRWRVYAVCVDSVELSRAGREAATTALREATGITDTIWFDDNLAVYRQWGLLAVPSVILTGQGGRIIAIEKGWDSAIEARIDGLMSGTVAAVESDSLTIACGRDLTQAVADTRRGQSLRAATLIRNAFRSCPGWAAPAVLAAHSCWSAGDSAGTRQWLSQALAADSSDSWALTSEAMRLYRLGAFESALRLAQEAASQDGHLGAALSIQARVYLAEGRGKEAQDVYGILSRLNMLDPAYEAIDAQLRTLAGDLNGALTVWRRAIEARLGPIGGD